MIIPPEKFATRSLLSSPRGKDICRVLSAVIDSADASMMIKKIVSIRDENLNVENLSFSLSASQRVFVIGAGKAVIPMSQAIVEILGNRVTSGVVVTKDGYEGTGPRIMKNTIEILHAGHPVPDERSLAASSKLITIAENCLPGDLVICLISGGGSSLLSFPSPGLSLKDIQETTSLLLSCGATIDQINVVRKHLDGIKGGGLARAFFPATMITLILSDVMGDNLEMVASGPTVADPTTYADARRVLENYQIWELIPTRVRTHINEGIRGTIPETVKPGDRVFEKVSNLLVGNNTKTALASVQVANDLGFTAELLPMHLSGEASRVGQAITEWVKTLLEHSKAGHPTCFIAGGEATVTVRGPGKGGRTLELALGAVKSLSTAHEMVLASLATDGGDGPTDSAGAVATNQTLASSLAKGLDPVDYLLRNDSYNYFDQLGDLIKIGPTFTNVNDLLFIFAA